MQKNNYSIAISALNSFHVSSLSWLNWNLEMFLIVEGSELEYLEKNPQSKARTNIKLYQHMVFSALHHPCSVLQICFIVIVNSQFK